MPLKIVGGFSIKLIVPDQHSGIGNLIMIFKAAPGVAVTNGEYFSMHTFSNITPSISGRQKMQSEARAAQLLAVRWMLLLALFYAFTLPFENINAVEIQ